MITIETNDDGTGCLVRIEGELTIDQAEQFRAAVYGAFELGCSVTVDLQGATVTDLTCLQILCSACMTSYARMKPIKINGLSEELMHTVENGGLTRFPETGDECCWLSGGYHG